MCLLVYFYQNHVGVIIERRTLFLKLPTRLPGVIHTSPHCMGSCRGPEHAPLDTFLCSYPTIRKRSSSPMTLNHGHFVLDNKTVKVQQKSQVALAHAADCRKQLVYIDGTSGKLTNLASASVGPFPSRILIFATVEKHLLFPGVANDHQSRIFHAK